MKTKERLVNDLLIAKAPSLMIENAYNGFYDDYESIIATPITRLVNDALANGLKEIARKAKNGDYDCTKEEANEWMAKNARRYIK